MDTTHAQRRRLGDAVRKRRKAAGLTQAQLAALVDAHTQTIGNLERGIHEPKPELLAAVGRILHMETATAALAIRETVDVIHAEILGRLDELDEIAGLAFVANVWRYVSEWQPSPPTTKPDDDRPEEPTSGEGVVVPKPRASEERMVYR